MALIFTNRLSSYIPKRVIIIILCISANIICYAGIVYMAKEFNWNHTIQGYVSSSFYLGYLTSQIMGGILADKFGGRRVLGIAAAIWTLFTLLTPISARINIYCLILCRICLGIGEGINLPCLQSLVSKWFPPEERSRAVSALYVSNFIGMVITMPISNLLGSSQFGWESIFWVFATIGSIWSMIWYFYGKSDPKDYPGISKEELDWILKNKSIVCSEDNFGNYQSGSSEYITITNNDHKVPKNENDMLLPKNQISSRPLYVHKIPWKLLFSRREVWAILLCQFFGSCCFFILLNWLPIFYYEYFHVDIHLIGFYTALPYLSYVIMGFIAGYICDYAIHQLKFKVVTVRKSFNIIATLGLLIPLLLTTYLAKTSLEGLLLITIGFTLFSFQVPSVYASQLDIGPKHVGVICGLGNTCGLLPAFFGVALTGWILEVTSNDWSTIWCICSLFKIIGTAFYVSWAGGEVIIE
ncbi:major facilitator superfamily domain-containing protein [Gigaspora rosea]|uniref:Major facilitator superfamily domain-containing protein n=1 Tax=Gigaspora rosea TaxID=44941 RepID=A0A397W071_9GLOM|nr:major facilitator superfamily domain-containing protein [Gigaspora rosea]